MLGSIYIGMSGMSAFSKGLQTVSNNVANLNSPGFKSTTTNFSDIFSYGGRSQSAAPDLAGAGNGVRFHGEQVDFGQGDLRQSENELDLAINGRGFLVLLNEGKTYYARTGQFIVDKNGDIVEQASGYKLAILDGSGRAAAINIDGKRTNPPKVTTTIKFADNLSSSATTASVNDIVVYDVEGDKHVWSVKFDRPNTTSDWKITVTDSKGTTVGTSTLKFTGGTVDPTTSHFSMPVKMEGSADYSVDLDFSTEVTSYSGGTASTIRSASVDGYGVGALANTMVDKNGQLKLVYSNEQNELLGAVAIADFRDPQQLTRITGGLFESRSNLPMRILPSGTDGIGSLVSKQLEASNVDLSKEFGDLILIQRGFQASSQVVSVTNDMIQELFGIRGRG